MRTILAQDVGTPPMLSKRATFAFYHQNERIVFFVTWMHASHIHIVRSQYAKGIQIAFRYY